MSKAFVREGDDGDDDDDGGDEALARPRSPYITTEGARRLQDELTSLWKTERPRVTAEVTAAAAQGDRSENAEYQYGKRKLREIDRRIRYLSKRLDEVEIVVPSAEQEGRVFFGAWVTIEDEDGARTTYRIVGSDELDLVKGHITIDSPVAKALLGKRVGDEVVVVRPRGSKEYTITAITYRSA